MAITILAAVMMMIAYFLILYAGVAFIQDKRFFFFRAAGESGCDSR